MEKKAQTLSAMGARSRVIEVYEASEKAGDVAVVLGSAIEKLSTAADKGCKLSSAAVKRVVQELSQAMKASEKIQDTAKSGAARLAGSSGGYVINRLTSKKKRDGDWEEGRSKRLGGKEEQASRRLKEFVQKAKTPAKKQRAATGLGKENMMRNFKVTLKPLYPLPANGTQYMTNEAAMILMSAKKTWPIIRDWVKLKLVPVTKSKMYMLLLDAKDMQPIPSTWSTRGRPALLTTDQVEALVEERTSGGNTIGVREMNYRHVPPPPEGGRGGPVLQVVRAPARGL